MTINLDRLTAAVSDHSTNLQKLLDLARADAENAATYAAAGAQVDKLSAYVEQLTGAITDELAAREGAAAVAAAVAPAPPAAG